MDTRTLRHQLKESAWLLGICENGFDDLKAGRIHWIDNGRYGGRKWFADPFILDQDKLYVYLLVEEFDYQVHRGRIAKLWIDRKSWTVVDCKIVLDLDTHLSFPMIWRESGQVYVCPENYHSGGWNMYRYDADNEKLEFVQQLSDQKLTDAIVWQDGSDYWLLSTYEPKPNGAELTIWKSNGLTGKYQEIQRVIFNENIGRNAGMLFRQGEGWIRPAQESNNEYGHSISFQIMTLKNGWFSFKELYRFHSPHPVYDAGTHTFNTFGNMAVIDVKGYRHRGLARLMGFVGGLLVKAGLKKPFVIQ